LGLPAPLTAPNPTIPPILYRGFFVASARLKETPRARSAQIVAKRLRFLFFIISGDRWSPLPVVRRGANAPIKKSVYKKIASIKKYTCIFYIFVI
jgi:hypothetical protein